MLKPKKAKRKPRRNPTPRQDKLMLKGVDPSSKRMTRAAKLDNYETDVIEARKKVIKKIFK